MDSIVLSVLALSFSIISFCISLTERRRAESQRHRLEAALFDIERDTVFEGRLGEWPNALRFHGIDVEAAEKDSITAKDIEYIGLSVGGLSAYCDAVGVTIYDQLLKSDYRQRMFAQLDTRRVWKYARSCIPAVQRAPIDRFLKEKYGEDYGPI